VENRNAGPDCEMGKSQDDLRSADGEIPCVQWNWRSEEGFLSVLRRSLFL